MSSDLKLKEPISFVTSANIQRITDSHYIMYVATNISTTISDYVGKSANGCKIIFAQRYAKGAKWIED